MCVSVYRVCVVGLINVYGVGEIGSKRYVSVGTGRCVIAGLVAV